MKYSFDFLIDFNGFYIYFNYLTYIVLDNVAFVPFPANCLGVIIFRLNPETF